MKKFIAAINWDKDGQPKSSIFEDFYFSTDCATEETHYVFILNNDLKRRFQKLPEDEHFVIAETGFGSGLNFLCAWQCWRQHAPKGAKLHFISTEKYPLQLNDLQRVLNLWPSLTSIGQQLLEQYPPVEARGFHRLYFPDNVALTLIFDDAEASLEQLLPINNIGPKLSELGYGWSDKSPFDGLVNAWFLDGFAPAKNPDMWTESLFKTLAKLSYTQPGQTTMATFTAATVVRRNLENVGFDITKIPGFGKKRQMLKGHFIGANSNNNAKSKPNENTVCSAQTTYPQRLKADASWHLFPYSSKTAKTQHIAIIGAGLAGSQTAFCLANKGFKVTIIDRQKIGSGASGNPQGILYSKLSLSQGVFTDFNLTAYLFACRFYKKQGFFKTAGNDCGVLQLAETAKQAKQYQNIALQYEHSPELVIWLDSTKASEKSGVKLEFGGLWLAQAGLFSPPQLCKALIKHPNIRLIEETQIERLTQCKNKQWQLYGTHNKNIIFADTVIIACAYSAKQFEQCQKLPTKAIRGQISLALASKQSTSLKTVLCGTGYITPSKNNQHCIGATFNLTSNSTEMSLQDHKKNITNIQKMSSSFARLSPPSLLSGRVSFRCTTPDYLPIVGPVADETAMLNTFAAYRTNLKTTIDKAGTYWPGLYLNIGHGSKGLTYTPLCAEILSSMITGEPLPLSRDLMTHIHSARFLIRDLARNRL